MMIMVTIERINSKGIVGIKVMIHAITIGSNTNLKNIQMKEKMKEDDLSHVRTKEGKNLPNINQSPNIKTKKSVSMKNRIITVI